MELCYSCHAVWSLAGHRRLGRTGLAFKANGAGGRRQSFQCRANSGFCSEPNSQNCGRKFVAHEDAHEGEETPNSPFSSAGFQSVGSVDGSVDEDLEFWTLPNTKSLGVGSASLWGRVSQVYVILFGVGQSDTEGIYSLRALSIEDGLPHDTIIAFEEAVDAERYAGLLEATMEHVPSVCPIDSQELLEFCMESGYSCRLETRGSLLFPPDFNVGVTDWERLMRLREGRFSVLDYDPKINPSHVAKQLQYRLPYSDAGWSQVGAEEHTSAGEYTQEQLDEIKRRLERLVAID